ncbi:DUF2971 domain-containing protein [Arcticibacter eurypsychrophilus]|uniref:DUF2971 domain-containing protein n=1 Tax=Arcticibacter eurypsychrophilus TaxID=1434752 RepID=UPI00084D1326|nr:DUF2971 domain-containing protein [Arcticibacter eurypsychrophilus]
MNNQTPDILYKYTSWSGDISDPKTDILFKNIFWFSNPVDFNDPFDCMLPVLFDESYYRTRQFYNDWFKAMVKIGKENLTPQEIDMKVEEILLKPNSIIFSTDIMTDSIRCIINSKTRISCFTSENNNLLMWSHYADCYRGVCLGFETTQINDSYLVMLEEVKYSENFPKLKSLTNIPLLTTKSTYWKYEKEFRLINIGGYNKIEFDQTALKEVIIGFKMDKAIKAALVEHLRNAVPQCIISQASPSERRFEIEIKVL